MCVEALGYICARTRDLSDWASYGPRLLGLQRVDKSRSTLAFRMDDRKQRITVRADGGEGLEAIGWEVQDGLALESLAAKLERAGIEVSRGSRALADERHVADLIVLDDPLGNRVEIFHGAHTSPDPFRPGRPMSGFRTGPLGLGHVVLGVESVEAIEGLMHFYLDLLGFRLTDYYARPFQARFLHVNPRHHSLALIETGRRHVHHLMIEALSCGDMGRAYEIGLSEARVTMAIGRHTSDSIASFYSSTPSGFMIEYGWGACPIDPDTWRTVERKDGPSAWGHEPLSTEDQVRARELHLKRAAERLDERALTYEPHAMRGVCPWWDSIRG
jgi:2,3-dihydroxybiphenyl 1,2-dioxygenase